MNSIPTSITVALPDWCQSFCQTYVPTTDTTQQMQFIISAASNNAVNQTGGPFAAGIFTREAGELIALGVNIVTLTNLSSMHAEIVAISLAQQRLQHWDLSSLGNTTYQLVCSSEPCAMCLGAIPWSGIHGLICGASTEEARAIGFDEGHIPANWSQALADRCINVQTGVLSQNAKQVLIDYQQSGGTIYSVKKP